MPPVLYGTIPTASNGLADDLNQGRAGGAHELLGVDRAVVVRSSGDRRLDAAAIRAALAWRYEPAHRGRRAMAGVDTATFEFYREGRGRR